MSENSEEVARLREAVALAEKAFNDLVGKSGHIEGDDLAAAERAHQAIGAAKDAVAAFLRDRDQGRD